MIFDWSRTVSNRARDDDANRRGQRARVPGQRHRRYARQQYRDRGEGERHEQIVEHGPGRGETGVAAPNACATRGASRYMAQRRAGWRRRARRRAGGCLRSALRGIEDEGPCLGPGSACFGLAMCRFARVRSGNAPASRAGDWPAGSGRFRCAGAGPDAWCRRRHRSRPRCRWPLPILDPPVSARHRCRVGWAGFTRRACADGNDDIRYRGQVVPRLAVVSLGRDALACKQGERAGCT